MCHLEVIDCGFSSLSCEALAQKLKDPYCGRLNTIKLDHNAIGDEHLGMLVPAFAQHRLHNLSLCYTKLTSKSGTALKTLLASSAFIRFGIGIMRSIHCHIGLIM